jgi:uncharacterized circularly permuted ATP-grasp superfamily protein
MPRSRDSGDVVTAPPTREGSFYVPASGTYDEAITPGGELRPGCGPTLEALRGDPAGIARRINEAARSSGVVFNSYRGDEAFLIDPSPRVIEAAQWAELEAGVSQRVRALDEFVADTYGERRAVAEGVISERVIETAEHFDPGASGLRPPQGVWIGVAGLDVVRGADGEILVLEDNVRTPSGMAYAMAARNFVLDELRGKDVPLPIDGAVELLRETLLAAAPGESGDDPYIVFLSDGPGNPAWWEHVTLSDRLGIALVTGDGLETRGTELWLREGGERPIDIVYRRTDACDSTSWVGELLGPALGAGSIGVVNGFGTGVADDKLVHAYVEDLIRFYLGEEPLLRSVKTFDLNRPDDLEEALDRVAELVVKPRGGSGGVGVVICPHADEKDVLGAREAMASNPSSYVAQELVMLSTHPTVIDGELQPRHVDLRPFVFLGPDREARVLPGGLTRVAFDQGALIVNSSQNGGAKDTWVMAR